MAMYETGLGKLKKEYIMENLKTAIQGLVWILEELVKNTKSQEIDLEFYSEVYEEMKEEAV